ncbi:MAG: hypothetical protein ACJAUL_002993 [Paraglaciecola sp.]|jgi:uncharacterized protein (TIGR02118 family)
MKNVKLIVFYPHPADVDEFKQNYREHLNLLHRKMDITDTTDLPYTVTRFASLDGKDPQFYQMFMMPFPSMEALQQVLSSEAMQEVAADATRISSGGPPSLVIGRDE